MAAASLIRLFGWATPSDVPWSVGRARSTLCSATWSSSGSTARHGSSASTNGAARRCRSSRASPPRALGRKRFALTKGYASSVSSFDDSMTPSPGSLQRPTSSGGRERAIDEAAAVLRISRTLAYKLAAEWRATNGREGLPVVRLGSRLVVRRVDLAELLGFVDPAA